MKITLKDLSSTQKEFCIEVPFSDLEPFINQAIEMSKSGLEVKGFRKGNVPTEIAKKELSQEDILAQAAELAVKEYYPRAIKEKQLEVIGSPEIAVTKLAQGNPLEFKARVWIMPEVELPDYRRIASQVKKKPVSVKGKEMEETVKWLQRARAKTSPKDGPCRKGDLVKISYSSSMVNQGKEMEEQVVLGQSHLLPDFEKNLIGMEENQGKEFSVSFPGNYINKELAGKDVRFRAKMLKVEQIELPEINDRWAKGLGNFENISQLKENIRQGIQKEKEGIEKQRVQAEIINKIAQETRAEIPTILIDAETANTVKDLKARIPQMLKMSFEEYLNKAQITEDEFEKSLLPEVKAKIKKFLILREIKEREDIRVDEQEIKQEVDSFLVRFKTAKEAEKVIDPETLKEYTKERIETKKTLEFLESLAG